MFSIPLEKFLPFSSNQKVSSTNSFSLEESKFVAWERVKRIYFTLIEKQVLTTCTNLPQFRFLGTIHQYSRQTVCGQMKVPKLTPAPGNQTRELMLMRPTLYLTTTDTTK